MKKIISWVLVVIATLLIAVYFVVPTVILKMITTYPKYSFETVLDYDSMRADFGIYNFRSPEDYGFKNVGNVDFKSLYDSIKLNGWYVPSDRAVDSCIILVHGRTSNRLKTMKYLRLIDTLKLDTLYNVFIPDLRNSGKSQAAKTFMGYKFAEDLTASLLLMHRQHHQKHIVLYGFSMGCMAIMNAIYRPDLKEKIDSAGIVIDKIILDSPLSNVKATLQWEAEKMRLPQILFNKTFREFSSEINGYGDKMKMSVLLSGTEIPILALQSKDDNTTPYFILEKELKAMGSRPNMQEVYFEGPDHVRTFQTSKTRQRYIASVKSFLEKR